MPTSQSGYITNNKLYDVILLKLCTKNAQISETDFRKPQNCETSCYLCVFKCLGVICE